MEVKVCQVLVYKNNKKKKAKIIQTFSKIVKIHFISKVHFRWINSLKKVQEMKTAGLTLTMNSDLHKTSLMESWIGKFHNYVKHIYVIILSNWWNKL